MLAMADDVKAAHAAPRDRLAARRRALGLTQEELAALLGVERSTVVRWERGATQPLPWIRPKLAKVLQVPVGQLAELLGGPAPAGQGGRGPAVAPVPRQLPPAVADFVGRAGELAALTALLDQTAESTPPAIVISSIGGTAGVGKTALAVHWAHQVAGQFSGGQLYVNLRGFDPSGQPMPTATAIRVLLDALGVPPARIPADLDAQVGLYRSLIAGRRMLLVLDNARDALQVRPLLPGSPGCLVVVTSRSQLAGLIAVDGAHPLTLGLLTDAEAVALLTARLGATRMAAESGAAAELARLCARLPLALAIAAARMAANPQLGLGMLADQLADARRRLDMLDTGDPPASVRAVFSWSVSALPAWTARMFMLLGLHPGPEITASAAASLAAVSQLQAEVTLRDLAGASLIIEQSPGRYTLHDLTRDYVTELARAPGIGADNHEATSRILNHYLHAATAAARAVNPRRRHVSLPAPPPGCTVLEFSDSDTALRWLKSEHANLAAAIRHAAEQGEHEIAWKLPIELWDLYRKGYCWTDWITSVGIGLTSARVLADQAAQAWLLNHLAMAYQLSGDTERTINTFREAIEIRELIGDRHGAAVVLANLARTLAGASMSEESLQCLQQAMDVFTQAGNLVEQGRCLSLLSATYRQLGRLDDAICNAQQAVQITRQVGDATEESAAHVNLALAIVVGDHSGSAVTHATRAVELARAQGDPTAEAEAFAALANVLLASGQPDQAHEALGTARRIFSGLGLTNTDQWATTPT